MGARLGDINEFEVYNFGHLFTSAFRIVVDYFSSVREGWEEEFSKDTRTFRHVEEMLEFFRIFSGDQRYQEIGKPILEKAEKGELISMCTLMDTAINKGWEREKSKEKWKRIMV